MPTDPGPFDIDTTPLVLGPGCAATPKAVSPRFYEELAEEFDGFAGPLAPRRVPSPGTAGRCTPEQDRLSSGQAEP